jgi:WD40 repeat protein
VYFYQLHVSPDGKHISTLERILGAQEFTRLARWNTTTGKIEHQHSLPAGARTCAWFRDGSTVALALAEALALVDVKTGRRRFQVAGTSASGPVTVSPDDRLVAVPLAGNKGEQAAIGVWETATGKEVARVATGKVHHLRMLPGNRFLLTTDEQFLRVWDLATRSERLRWPLPEAGTDDWGRSFVFGLEASPDGQQAITILADGTALVWDLMPAWRDRPPEVKR